MTPTPETTAPAPWRAVPVELPKLAAFFRRDLMVMLSYGLAIASDWMSLIFQLILFAFVGRMVNPGVLPDYTGGGTTYLEFVTIGVAVTAFVQVGLGRVMKAIRNEQLMGTLEAVLLTPTSLTTFQLGSVMYDLAYVPIRTLGFLALAAVVFDLRIAFSQLPPALAVLLLFIPCVWGLGVASAAAMLTFRRGSSIFSFGVSLLVVGSGAYFPVDLLPTWTHGILRLNPLTITMDAVREALLGSAGWAAVLPDLLLLLPMSALAMVVGTVSFRLALRRELRRGTVNLY